jgi:hypothetical protein
MDSIHVAKVIQVIHIAFIIYMILMPFIAWNNKQRILYFWVSSSVLIHWFAGNSICALTLLEEKVLGIPNDQSFIYRTINPIYDLSQTISDGEFRLVVRFVTMGLWWLNFYILMTALPTNKLQTFKDIVTIFILMNNKE